MITRRHLLGTAGAGAALAVSGLGPKFSNAEAAGVGLSPGVPEGVSSYVTMGTLPGKKPLIKLTYRPPNYETPLEYLRSRSRRTTSSSCAITLRTFRRSTPRPGSSGRRRRRESPSSSRSTSSSGLPRGRDRRGQPVLGQPARPFEPHVPGVEWGYGAMGMRPLERRQAQGRARQGGLKKEAVEVAFDGADGPVIDKTPDFVKSLPVWKAIDETRWSPRK